jgi:hypothetical protein
MQMDTKDLAAMLLTRLGYETGSSYHSVATKLGTLVDVTMSTHAYHNKEHVQHAVVSAYDLGRAEGIDKKDVALLVIAMVGHDLAHPGRSNKMPFENERAAIRMMQPVIQSLPIQDQTKITHAVLATDPTQYDVIRERYLSAQARGSVTIQDRLNSLAVESDLAGSISVSTAKTRDIAKRLTSETGIVVIDTPEAQRKFAETHEPYTTGSNVIGAVVKAKEIQKMIAEAYNAPLNIKMVQAQLKRREAPELAL